LEGPEQESVNEQIKRNKAIIFLYCMSHFGF
jgi:hypothetical protein